MNICYHVIENITPGAHSAKVSYRHTCFKFHVIRNDHFQFGFILIVYILTTLMHHIIDRMF